MLIPCTNSVLIIETWGDLSWHNMGDKFVFRVNSIVNFFFPKIIKIKFLKPVIASFLFLIEKLKMCAKQVMRSEIWNSYDVLINNWIIAIQLLLLFFSTVFNNADLLVFFRNIAIQLLTPFTSTYFSVMFTCKQIIELLLSNFWCLFPSPLSFTLTCW